MGNGTVICSDLTAALQGSCRAHSCDQTLMRHRRSSAGLQTDDNDRNPAFAFVRARDHSTARTSKSAMGITALKHKKDPCTGALIDDAKIANGRGDRIRTYDPLPPRQVRYQAALRPDDHKTDPRIIPRLVRAPQLYFSAAACPATDVATTPTRRAGDRFRSGDPVVQWARTVRFQHDWSAAGHAGAGAPR